jgi:hypothetical protein
MIFFVVFLYAQAIRLFFFGSCISMRRRRTSAEGEREDLALAAHAEFVPGHPELSLRISQLHASLAHDDHAQSEIDAHLLAAAVAMKGLSLGFPLRSLVFSSRDAPQFSTLPDLGPVLRSCLVFRQWNSNYLSHCLYCCMPVPRSASKIPQPDSASCAILFNVLLATLLGLYPSCVKKPPFSVRCQLFSRVHSLLTAPYEVQSSFATKYKILLVFSLAEYVCRLIPQLFPSERESICSAQAVEAFFIQGPALFDAFRQDTVDSGQETWHDLSTAAQEAHDRLSRTYRSKCRLPQQARRVQPADATKELLAASLASPRLVTYPFHRASPSALRDEYTTLLGSPDFAEVSIMHSLIRTAPLPDSVRQTQVSADPRLGLESSTREPAGICF